MNKLPLSVDPVRFAREKVDLAGELPLSECSRLQAIHDQRNAQAFVTLKFFKDEAGIYAITGCVKATVYLDCERCGEVMQFKVESDVSLSPVVSDRQAVSLPPNYEPLVTAGDPVNLVVLIEEEILLALPMVPKHSEMECLNLAS